MKSLLCQCRPEVLLLMGGSVFICLIQFLLQEYNNDLSKRLNEVVNEIRRQRCSYLRLRLLKRGDPLEYLFFSYLVEDKSPLGFSYVEFLVHVHRQIQNRMA
jgi:protein transport protein SEC24